jgi:hypothetical protein
VDTTAAFVADVRDNLANRHAFGKRFRRALVPVMFFSFFDPI